MTDFLSRSAEVVEPTSLSWLQGWQTSQATIWQSASWPTRKTEHWRYTPLKNLERLAPHALATRSDAQVVLPVMESIDLVFVDGHFHQHLSGDVTGVAGLKIVRFADADSETTKRITGLLGQQVDSEQHLFAAHNSAALQDGVFIEIDKDVAVERPIRIVQRVAASQAVTVAPRLLVQVGSGASACVIEYFDSGEEAAASWVNSITEVFLGESAKLEHYRLHLEDESLAHIGGVHAYLEKASELSSYHFAFGGVLKRIDAVVTHAGEGAHCTLNGIYLPQGSQHIDYHTTIEHAVPHGTTEEIFRGIVADQSRAVFNGRIHIHPDAQKTVAQLSNKNLLTSHKAEVDTKPELEIYADDVRCAHGATVAQLDDKALHYMKTRGIGELQARELLSAGFINEVLDAMPNDAIVDVLRARMASTFAKAALGEVVE